MTPVRAVIVGFVFLSFLQDSFEADFTSVPDLKAASDKVSLKRRAICKSLCRSKSQDITHFEKVRKDVKIWVCFLYFQCASYRSYILSLFFIRQILSYVKNTQDYCEVRPKTKFFILWTFSIHQLRLFWIFNTMTLILCSFTFWRAGSRLFFELMTGSVSQFHAVGTIFKDIDVLLFVYICAFSTIDHKF